MDRIYLVGEIYTSPEKVKYPVKKDFSIFEYVESAKSSGSSDMSVNEQVVLQLELDGCI